MRKSLFAIIIVLNNLCVKAQFPGIAGTPGSTAIDKDSSIIIGWATNCMVQRGMQDITNPAIGLASSGDSSMATGIADGVGVVSLGDGGMATLTFDSPIQNGPGFDFAVFENAFIDEFLELAFVEVSSNGIDYFRFPSISNTPSVVQTGPFDYNSDPTMLNNLAGKYRALYGTPFDLEELSNVTGLNTDAITHVRIVDVVGSIDKNYATYDSNNHPINDPFPTPFPQGGFDLDAVAVLNDVVHGTTAQKLSLCDVYPNPFATKLQIACDQKNVERIELWNYDGHIMRAYFGNAYPSLDTDDVLPGLYFLVVYFRDGSVLRQKIICAKLH